MTENTPPEWGVRLRRLVEPLVEAAPPIVGFADEAGHRRPVDRPFLAWRRREAAPTPIEPGRHADVDLWTDVAADAGADAALATLARHGHDPDAGSILPPDDTGAIEVWTETELACLHALTWLRRRSGDERLAALVRRAVDWHVRTLQPDNATNHPWAIHAFIGRAHESGDHGARLYAETLLSNCMVSLGRPDAFSAHVLADAADALAPDG